MPEKPIVIHLPEEDGRRRVTIRGEMVGRAGPAYTDWGSLDLKYHHVAEVHEDKCINCNLCVVACDDAGYGALVMKSVTDKVRTKGTRQVAELVYDNCTGCNLCVAVCPVPECMTLYDSKEPFPYELHATYAGNTLKDPR